MSHLERSHSDKTTEYLPSRMLRKLSLIFPLLCHWLPYPIYLQNLLVFPAVCLLNLYPSFCPPHHCSCPNHHHLSVDTARTFQLTFSIYSHLPIQLFFTMNDFFFLNTNLTVSFPASNLLMDSYHS